MPDGLLLLIARVLVAALFVPAGWTTLADVAASSAYFASLGFSLPVVVAWGTGLFEFVAGALVLVGLMTRPTAILLAIFALSAGVIGHYGQGVADPLLALMHQQMLFKDIAVAGGLVALAVAGAGTLSLDARLR